MKKLKEFVEKKSAEIGSTPPPRWWISDAIKTIQWNAIPQYTSVLTIILAIIGVIFLLLHLVSLQVVTTLLICVALVIVSPFVAFGFLVVCCAILIGIPLFFAVTLLGIEPSGAVFLTCCFVGGLVLALKAIGNKAGGG